MSAHTYPHTVTIMKIGHVNSIKMTRFQKIRSAATDFWGFFWMSKKKETNQVIYKGEDAAETLFQGVLLGMITCVSLSPTPSPGAAVSLPVWAFHTQGPALSKALAGKQKHFHAEVGVWTCLCVCSTSGSCSTSFWEVLLEWRSFLRCSWWNQRNSLGMWLKCHIQDQSE